MLRFSSEQLIENAGTDDFDYVIVCWNTTPEVDRYIGKLGAIFKESHPRLGITRVDHQTIDDIGYVPNLRAMINAGFDTGFEMNEYGGLVNTDQAFFMNWLKNLLKHRNPKGMVTSTLIEMGETRHLQADFGLTEYGIFDLEGFNNMCEAIIQPGTLISEAEREGIWGDPGYMNIESLPYIFPRKMWRDAGPWELSLSNGTPDVNFFDRAHASGYEFVMSGDSIAYHVGGVERGIGGTSAPAFAEGMPYDPPRERRSSLIVLAKRVASRLHDYGVRAILSVNLLIWGMAYRRRLISKVLLDEGTVLDVGCGGLNDTALEEFLAPRKFTRITGLDIHRPSVVERRAWYKSDDRYEFLCRDIRDMDLLGEFDLVTMFHVIEHLTETEAANVLEYIKTIARKLVLLETPDQFDNSLATVRAENNPHQRHKSLITQEFMNRHGFTKIGSYVEGPGYTNTIYVFESRRQI